MKKKIVCSGTFDKLHTGHVKYLKESKALVENGELIVIVARDSNSERIKGKKTLNNENKRFKRILDLDFVDKAVLGFEEDNAVERVLSLEPDIIALGHDQWAKEKWLDQELKNKGLDVKIIRMPKFSKKYLKE